jgi:hypothetical protein
MLLPVHAHALTAQEALGRAVSTSWLFNRVPSSQDFCIGSKVGARGVIWGHIARQAASLVV